MKINHNPEILVNGYDELRDLFTRTLIATLALLFLPIVAVNGAKTVDTLSELPYQVVVALVAAQDRTADFMASGFYEGVTSAKEIAPMVAYEATSGAADLLSLYQRSFDRATLLSESAILAFGQISDGIADNAYAAVVSIPHDMSLLALNYAQASQPQAVVIDQDSQDFFSQTSIKELNRATHVQGSVLGAQSSGESLSLDSLDFKQRFSDIYMLVEQNMIQPSW